MRPRRVVPCPECGLSIVFDDETRTIRHEKPDCAEYTRRMAMAGMQARRAPWQAAVIPTTGEVLDVAVTVYESPAQRHVREVQAGTAHAYRVPSSPCPGCGAPMDAASTVVESPPEPGDPGVCVACGTLVVLDQQLNKRLLTEAELAAFDEETRREMLETSATYRARALVRPLKGQA